MKLNVLAVTCLFSVVAASPGFPQPPTVETSKTQTPAGGCEVRPREERWRPPVDGCDKLRPHDHDREGRDNRSSPGQ